MVETPSRYQLWLPFDEPHELSGPSKPLDVEKTLRRLLKQDLTFKGERTTHATHKLHAFAAKFPPQLPRLFIHELTLPGEWVLDAMAGSGTALVETVLAGRHAIGIDLDPLAVLIAQVKIAPLNLPRCVQVGTAVLQKARQSLPSTLDKALSRFYSPRAVAFFHYWFEEHTIAELYALSRGIQTVEDVRIRAFLQVVFSSAIITKTGGLTRARDLAHSRPHRDLNRRVMQSAFEVFTERLYTAIKLLEEIVDVSASARVVQADARALPLRDNCAHLIVTSPPYAANAIDYMRGHKFSLMWFGYEPKTLTELRRKYIGAEFRSPNLVFASDTANRVLQRLRQKDERRATVVAHYFRDMEAALREMLRVLAEGRAAVLVVGSSIIRGIDIKAPTVLTELADAVGFRVIGLATREIMRNARMMPVSHNSSRSGIEARMHEEGVIGLIKPQQNNMPRTACLCYANCHQLPRRHAMNDETVSMPQKRVLGFGIYLIVLNLVLVYILMKIWPGKIPLDSTTAEQVDLLWGGMLIFSLMPETRYLMIVAVTGALGSYIHLATSFADFMGHRRLIWSWTWWYILRPFIAMALAVILYFVVRGGLITGDSGSVNPYGVAAIAGMAGMFSKQATDKLREVFENLFRTENPPDRSDKMKE